MYSQKQGVMFWGFFSGNGERSLDHITGTMNSTKYIEMLKKHISPLCSNRILQQDRAPCHESKLTRQFMEDESIITLDPWPASSPDLNPIENLWSILKKRVKERGPKRKNDLIDMANQEFDKLDDNYLKKLSESMSRRILDCIRNKGNITKY